MRHLISIAQLTQHDLSSLVTCAMQFKQASKQANHANKTLVNLFYEHSTRTRVSFEMAANHLGMNVINVDVGRSSEHKGEDTEDTIRTLNALGVSVFVVRHHKAWLPEQLTLVPNLKAHILNAGDGAHAHPSQALLDLMTILEHKPHLDKIKIAIVGDIRHSRVAYSLQLTLQTMGVGDVTLVAPKIWQPERVHYGRLTDSLEQGLEGADIIYCLRVQKERLSRDEVIPPQVYQDKYTVDSAALSFAKKDVKVMHPGPMNRGIEIATDVADGPHSLVLNQVQNGIYMRMAIIDSLLSN